MNSTQTNEMFDFDSNIPEFEDGICDFEVLKTWVGKSNAGNPMMTLNIRLTAPNGASVYSNEYIVENSDKSKSTTYKLKALLKSAGCIEMFDRPIKPSINQYVGLSGKCKTKLQHDETYGPKHVVVSYIEEGSAVVENKSDNTSVEDDDIPF